MTSVPTISNIRSIENTVETFRSKIVQELPAEIELVVRLETLSPRINAEVERKDNELVLQVFGGMLAREELAPEVLILLLCHEFGHFAGGPPLKSRKGWSSTEGQADYYSGLRCAKLMGLDEGTFLEAALKLASIYSDVTGQPRPRLESCDPAQVGRTNFGYPSVQCRLDTLVAGWTGLERPRCWFSQ